METVALEIVFAPDSVIHELALEWADEMTDDTFAEWYAGRGLQPEYGIAPGAIWIPGKVNKMTEKELYDAIVRLCQQFGFTNEETYDAIREVISTITNSYSE